MGLFWPLEQEITPSFTPPPTPHLIPHTSHFLLHMPHPSPSRLKALAYPVRPPFPRESAPWLAWKCSTGTVACSNFSRSREPLSCSSAEERKRFLPAAARTSKNAVFLLDSHTSDLSISLCQTLPLSRRMSIKPPNSSTRNSTELAPV